MRSSPRFETKKDPSRTTLIYVTPTLSNSQFKSQQQQILDTWKGLYACTTILALTSETSTEDLPAAALLQAVKANADDLVVVTRNQATAQPELILRHYVTTTQKADAVVVLPWQEQFAPALSQALSAQLPDLSVGSRLEPLTIAYYFEKRGELAAALAIYQAEQSKAGTLYLHQLNSRSELDDKIKQLQDIVAKQDLTLQDRYKVYSLNIAFNDIAYADQESFKILAEQLELLAYFKRWTDKPVTLELSHPQERSYQINLNMRWHDNWYWQEVKSLPSHETGDRILHFTPYYSLISRLLKLRRGVLEQLPGLQGEGVTVALQLQLNKANGSELTLPIHTNAQEQIIFPAELQVILPGYEKQSLKTNNEVLYQRYGYFTLGPAQLLSGQKTAWGLLYQFFNISE